MEAKEWLGRYRLLEQDIRAQKEHLARLSAAATSTTAKNTGGAPGASGVSRKIENAVIDAEVIKSRIREMQKEQRAIVRAIDNLKNPQSRAVLTFLYICGFTQEETAKKMGYADAKSVRGKRSIALGEIRIPSAYKSP